MSGCRSESFEVCFVVYFELRLKYGDFIRKHIIDDLGADSFERFGLIRFFVFHEQSLCPLSYHHEKQL